MEFLSADLLVIIALVLLLLLELVLLTGRAVDGRQKRAHDDGAS